MPRVPIRILFAALVATAACTAVQAGVVTSAVAVSGPPPFEGTGFTWERTIDQSGLIGHYVSGVTDFDTYVATLPRHIGSNTPPNYAASDSDPPQAVVYDLGSAVEILKLAFWNYPFAASAGPVSLQVFTSNNAGFATSTLVGTFVALNDGTGFSPPGNLVQVFDLIDTSARYVRINALTTVIGTGVGWSEVAFDVGALVIPEPETYALLLAGLGLLAFAARGRRKFTGGGSQ
jgi:hypothetical protein